MTRTACCGSETLPAVQMPPLRGGKKPRAYDRPRRPGGASTVPRRPATVGIKRREPTTGTQRPRAGSIKFSDRKIPARLSASAVSRANLQSLSRSAGGHHRAAEGGREALSWPRPRHLRDPARDPAQCPARRSRPLRQGSDPGLPQHRGSRSGRRRVAGELRPVTPAQAGPRGQPSQHWPYPRGFASDGPGSA